MAERINREDLEFDNTITQSNTGSPILGRITGPCADIVSATRNGRRYSEKLWEKVFNDPIVKEYFAAGGIFGELNHPTDREETDLEKVAICMSQPPVKNRDGKLIGTWDILNTPNGRIAKCLFDYGYKLGISSRGSGDTFTDYDGQESVDPDSYTLQGFDLVYLPAVKAARLKPVNESFDPTKKTFRKALNEALENSTEDERKIMTDTLESLNIDYNPDEEIVEKTIPEKDLNIEVEPKKDLAAEDNGAELTKELQEALKLQSELESKVESLQRKLSVCYTKETRYSDALLKSKTQLQECQKALETVSQQNKELVESVNTLKAHITDKDKEIKTLTESINNSKQRTNRLNENLTTTNGEVRNLRGQVKTLTEKYETDCGKLRTENKALQESLAEAQKDTKIAQSQCNSKLVKAQQLVEKYKDVARTAVDRYMKSEAVKIGVSVDDIKKRLNESYSFNDIDKVCEDLKSYKLSVNALPFRVGNVTPQPKKVVIKESKEVMTPSLDFTNVDDDVDESLLNIIR